MNQKLYFWVEKYLFNPTLLQKILSYILLPLSALYCSVVLIKRKSAKRVDYHLPIISIGNLIVGGSGKTPVTIALAQEKEDVFIILRGYKRASKGLIMISHKGEILEDIKRAGDEAMLFATALKNSSVIVSEDRVEAILYAKKLGAKVIFLDDGFSKSHIKKLDILIKPYLPYCNNFCLPSGPYREPKSLYHDNIVVEEKKDFKREVEIENRVKRMVLVTAISKPERLDPFLPEDIEKVYFPDHHSYTKSELDKILKHYHVETILTTTKDAVKMQALDIPLSILRLNITMNKEIIQIVDTFIEDFAKISQK